MKMGLVRSIAAGIENGGEVEAGGRRDRTLEGAVERRLLFARGDGEGPARLEGEARYVDGRAARMLGDLA